MNNKSQRESVCKGEREGERGKEEENRRLPPSLYRQSDPFSIPFLRNPGNLSSTNMATSRGSGLRPILRKSGGPLRHINSSWKKLGDDGTWVDQGIGRPDTGPTLTHYGAEGLPGAAASFLSAIHLLRLPPKIPYTRTGRGTPGSGDLAGR